MGITRTIGGNGTTAGRYDEIGTQGLNIYSGFVQQAYDEELYWPAVYKVYNRIRRSDAEISGIVRTAFSMMARGVKLEWQAPDEPTPDDKQAAEYGNTLFEDMDGGPAALIDTIANYVPFMGWGWWEVIEGVRNPNWRPPDEDEWRSEYDDGLPAIRRLAWRDHSSFDRWDADDRTGRVMGMVQHDYPNPPVMLPLSRSLHLTFGDPVNPEGLSPLEAVWRLDRIKYGLETIQGIGYERAAGYASFQAVEALTEADKSAIRDAARSILTAQHGNYIGLPGHIKAEIIDAPFSVAPSILEAIRYYGLLKLQVFMMQWAAVATTAGTGALAAHSDSSEMALMYFNSMWEGFANQIDSQLGRRIFSNPVVMARFPGMTKRPKLVAIPVEKGIPLNLLSQFVAQIAPHLPMDEDDMIAIRRKSGFLPENLPEGATVAKPEPPRDETPDEAEDAIEDAEDEAEDAETSEASMYRAVGELLTELKASIETGVADGD
jgi:hypothetical protein